MPRKKHPVFNAVPSVIEQAPNAKADGLPAHEDALGNRVIIKYPDAGHRRGRVSKLEQILINDFSTYNRMLHLIRNGAYDWVAAQALGIDPTRFATYYTKGEQDYQDIVAASLAAEFVEENPETDTEQVPISSVEASIYVKFYLDVARAKAQARLGKELIVAKDDPKFWLRCGPGRTRGDLPGWTEDTQKIELVGHLDHHHDGEIGYENVAPVDAETLAKALQTFEDLGLIKRTEKGALLFGERNGHREEEDIVEAMFDETEQ